MEKEREIDWLKVAKTWARLSGSVTSKVGLFAALDVIQD
jgi:hypothetical protein